MSAATGRSIWSARNAQAMAGVARHPQRSAPSATASWRSRPRNAPDCGYVFPAREVKIAPTAATLPVLSPKGPMAARCMRVSYSRHDKRGGRPSLKVTYSCGLKSYNEWVCVEHQGYARQKALEWWRKACAGLPDAAHVDDAIAQAGKLSRPTRSRSARLAAFLKSPATGLIHAPHQLRPLRRLPPGTSRVWLVQPDIHRLGQAAGPKPQTPLFSHLPGHLSHGGQA